MNVSRFALDDAPGVRRLVLVAGALFAGELLLLAAYFALSDRTVLAPRYVLYPFVWINTGLLALVVVDRPRARGRRRVVSLLAALGYLAVVTWLDGTVGAGSGAGTLRVFALSPGWGPALLYDGVVRLALFPYKVVGYLCLAYLVYVLTVDVAGSGLFGGVVGLLSCVSCTLPVAAAVLSGLLGGTIGLTAASNPLAYDLSTLAYVVSVGLLAWRPS